MVRDRRKPADVRSGCTPTESGKRGNIGERLIYFGTEIRSRSSHVGLYKGISNKFQFLHHMIGGLGGLRVYAMGIGATELVCSSS